ncbi:MazG-like family protein [Vagococcus carniphilus]|uniref:MazG-like family protein n=1 Tax=Vagococcus carniphilus TaxID=218144 RepID=UPI0028925D6B|nr:MazG-like family protein [Vagococcus carniphilus]MDT2815925.1 MazG-like family protein [Vagococcus carniphilus]
MDKTLQAIKQLAILEPKTLEQMALKLSEESGEVAQAVLSQTKASGNQYKSLQTEDIKEECIDTILVATALYYKLEGNSYEEFITLLTEKMTKWKQHLHN